MKDYLTAYLNVYEYIPFSQETLVPWLIRTGIAAGIVLVSWPLGKIFTRYVFNLLLKLSGKTKTNLDNHLVLAFQKPFRLLFLFLGLLLAFIYLPLSPIQDAILIKVFRSSLIVLIGLGLYELAGNKAILTEEIEKLLGAKVDKILIPFFSKVLKFVVVVLAISVILQEWDYDINGFITGLGLGGLAFALAAKDTLSNIFGGIVIITDKPFSIGDWISSPSVEGTVEDINFRSTKVRTFAQAVVTIPNSTLANEAVTNWSRMGKRRISFHLGVTYDTPRDKLEKCLQDIRNFLLHHKDIHQQTIFVNFDSFGESSLDIFLYFFTKTTNWGEFLLVKENVNLGILEILEREGVSIAFPSTSVYFENFLETKNSVPKNADI